MRFITTDILLPCFTIARSLVDNTVYAFQTSFETTQVPRAILYKPILCSVTLYIRKMENGGYRRGKAAFFCFNTNADIR